MSEAAVDDPLIGKVLSGRFQIVEPLGVGGMGRVYKAIQQPLDRMVALKVLNPRYDGAKDPGFERRFFLEASMTAKLKHPNTITVHDYGRTDEGIYFIAMEYLEGETLLASLNRDGAMPWPRALMVGAQVARSLREAHKLGLVHRDLKPANVMLLPEGTGGDVVKVLDFGLVKAFTNDLAMKSDVELTKAGVLLGSPLYMAPEQAKGETDQRTDIYALGILLFQCIAGRPPFQGKDSIEIIVKQVREKPPELRSLRESVPDDVNALVMKCLEKSPDARFQSMDELLEAMRIAVSGQGISGIFVDPRAFAATGTSQASRPPSSTRLKIASPSVPDFSKPVEVIASSEIEITASGTHPGKRRAPMIAGVAALVLLGGGLGSVIAWRSAMSTPEPVQPVPTVRVVQPAPPVAAVPKPAPEPVAVDVTFEIDSEPSGAEVIRNGSIVGVTPFSLTLPKTGAQPVTTELRFALDGYQTTTIIAQGVEGHVSVRPVLVRKKSVTTTVPVVKPQRPKQPKPTAPDYKDDPYQ